MNTYANAAVRKATGTPLATLQRYLDRNQITLQPCDQSSEGRGHRRRFSIRRIIQIALTTELAGLGISPSRAAKASFEFSDRGSPGRAIGEAYPLGTTLLVGLPCGENRVIQVPPDKTISDVLASDTAAFIIDAGKVVARVKEKLDTH